MKRIHFEHFIGQSDAIKKVIKIANKVADFDVPVLIEGDAGTGKEWLARAIHFASSRAKKDFIVIDCSEPSETILETALFGYVRGSFAGALQDRKGLLEIVDGGTIFLDHLSELRPALQSKFVKLIADGVYFKIGGVAEKRVDVRIVAATRKDIKSLVNQKQFREDLYYQLNVIRILMPPLRERRDDILPLAHLFLKKIAPNRETILSKDAEDLLLSYGWPGNIRELSQEVERAVLFSDGTKITAHHFSALQNKMKHESFQKKISSSDSLKEQKRELIRLLEKDAITEALTKTEGNRSKAARLLKISRQELIRKIAAYQIPL